MNEKNKQDRDEENRDFLEKLAKLEAFLGIPEEGTLKAEGISVFSNHDEALEYKRKMLERQKRRIEKRKQSQASSSQDVETAQTDENKCN